MDEHFAFLAVYGSPAGPTGLRGGIMVTDDGGVPLELRIAETVRADLLQRRAYGDTLQRYAVRELMAAPLLQALELQPRFTFANNLQCLEAAGPCPLVFLTQAESSPIVGEYAVKRVRQDDSSAPLWVIQSIDADSHILEAVHECVGRFQGRFDPLGAFQRIEGVIDLMADNDARFK